MKIVFLGGGNMANALIGGMVKQGFAASDIDVIDLGAEARTKLAASYGVTCHASADSAPDSPDILVLAVKPQQMKEAVAPLVAKLGNALVISIAAGLDMAALSRWLGGHRQIVRCMPKHPGPDRRRHHRPVRPARGERQPTRCRRPRFESRRHHRVDR